MKNNFSSAGSALLEVLITIVILALGLLGVAGLQARAYVLEFESYQRAQAIVILNDLVERISSDSESEATYVAASPLGGAGALVDCVAIAVRAERDACEISNLLKGEGERSGAVAIGAMDNARACVTSFTATATKAFNRCQTGVQVDVVWRGRSPTIVPSSACGAGLYGTNDAYRRVVSTRVATGDVAC